MARDDEAVYEAVADRKDGRGASIASPVPAVGFTSLFALAGALTAGAALGGMGVLAVSHSSLQAAAGPEAAAHDAIANPWYSKVANLLIDPKELPNPGEFSEERYGVLLTKDAPTLAVDVGFYVQVVGVSPTLPVVQSVSAPGNGIGGATHTFFRSAERLHVTKDSIWSTSQGCALRSIEFDGDLGFSLNTQDWGSGGFATDLKVKGTLDTGIQQQFIVKQSTVGDLAVASSSWNLVFVGLEGPTPSKYDSRYTMFVPEVPRGTQKPYLLKDTSGQWSVIVPAEQLDRTGYDPKPPVARAIKIEDCEVWSADTESAFAAEQRRKTGRMPFKANAPRSTASACVIVGPGIYQIDRPITISAKGAVVLGLGFATFRCTMVESCFNVEGDKAIVGGIVMDAAQPDLTKETGALIEVTGNDVSLYDVFARIAVLEDGLFVRADVMMRIVGRGVTLDNTWLWHADHDHWPKPFASRQVRLQPPAFHALL